MSKRVKRLCLWVALPLVIAVGAVSAISAGADTSSGGGKYVPLTAARIFNQTLATGEVRQLDVTPQGGIPDTGVSAILVDVTGVAPAELTHVDLWPGGTPKPGTPNLSVAAGDVSSNAAIVPVGTDGAIQIRSSAPMQILIDVQGYFTSAESGEIGAGGYVPLAAQRILNTQTGVGVGGAPAKIPAKSSIAVPVRGVAGVNNVAAAVFVNVTAVTPPSSGWLTVHPDGTTRPPLATVDFNTDTVSTSAAVEIGSSGSILLYNGNDEPMDVFVDIQGYFVPGASDVRGFTAVQARVFDSRVDRTSRVGPDETIAVTVGGTNGVPKMIDVAVAVGITATDATAAGYLRAWQAGAEEPETSNVDYQAEGVDRVMSIVPISDDGEILIHNVGPGPVHIIVDLQGWFGTANNAEPDDEELPAEKLAIGVQPVDPSLITDGPYSYVAPAADQGSGGDVAAVKSAVSTLVVNDSAVGRLPFPIIDRQQLYSSAAEVNRRATLINNTWAPSRAAAARSEWDAAMAECVNDPTYESYTDNRFLVQAWQGITVNGDRATAVVLAYEELERETGWTMTESAQWQVSLIREPGGPWRLDAFGSVFPGPEDEGGE